MKRTLRSFIRVVLILAALSISASASAASMFDSFGAINCEDEMARLDNVAIALQNSGDARAYIFVYGGKRGTYKDEVRVRGARMKRYLIETRGVRPDLLEFVDGGFRESFTFEIWIVQSADQAPTASPTVDAKTVRFKKGKMARYREPGCFPGKYLDATFHSNRMPVNK